jgi:hypothetical protein
MARYTVTPVDSTNAAETESMLKSMFGNVNIVTSWHHDEIASWTITSSDNELISSSIGALEGVRQVERQELVPRDQAVSAVISSYVAKPKENTDKERTDEFLKSKIQSNTHMVTIKDEYGQINVWFNVVLSHEAKEEVEKYDGIEQLVPLPGMASDSASIVNDSPQSQSKRSDIVARDTQFYGALAKDNSNITKTEEFLKTKVKNPDDIMHHAWSGEIFGWHNLELDSETAKEVEAYEGIKAIRIPKKLAESTASADDIPPPESKRAELATQDTQLYNAMATEDSDVKKTEEFLRSKVQKGEPIYQLKGRDGRVVGWYCLFLDAAAKQAVQDHEGIAVIKVESEMADFRALLTDKLPRSELQHKELFRRDFDRYQAMADNTTDPQETEDFLKSKVQGGKTVHTLKGKDNTIVGWFGLFLDPAALKRFKGMKVSRVSSLKGE